MVCTTASIGVLIFITEPERASLSHEMLNTDKWVDKYLGPDGHRDSDSNSEEDQSTFRRRSTTSEQRRLTEGVHSAKTVFFNFSRFNTSLRRGGKS